MLSQCGAQCCPLSPKGWQNGFFSATDLTAHGIGSSLEPVIGGVRAHPEGRIASFSTPYLLKIISGSLPRQSGNWGAEAIFRSLLCVASSSSLSCCPLCGFWCVSVYSNVDFPLCWLSLSPTQREAACTTILPRRPQEICFKESVCFELILGEKSTIIFTLKFSH